MLHLMKNIDFGNQCSLNVVSSCHLQVNLQVHRGILNPYEKWTAKLNLYSPVHPEKNMVK